MRQELEVLLSIFPELVLHSSDGNSCERGSIDIAVAFDEPRQCNFSTLPPFELLYLPPLKLDFVLPEGYPQEPPTIKLECIWLTGKAAEDLETEVRHLWQPGDDALYIIIDRLQEFAARSSEAIHLSDDLYPIVASYHLEATQKAFDEKSYNCEICLDDHAGTECVDLPCKHVFCKSCLGDMSSLHIKEGSINALHCPSCPHSKQTQDLHRIPLGVLKKVVSNDEVVRYSALLRKQELEALPFSTHCPRDFCATALPRDPDEKLVVCTACEYAFCADCKKTWHGPSEPCRGLVLSSELAERYLLLLADPLKANEQASMERRYGKKNLERLCRNLEDEKLADQWRLANAQRCPVCLNHVEKSMGCNHMICSICHAHFCFLCGDGLSSRNPYSHYSDKGLGCYGKLFEGLTGLEDDFAYL